MGNISTATICVSPVRGIVRAATCVQPPGAAHKSNTILASCKNGNLRLIWVNLKAARERYPCSLATVLGFVLCCFGFGFVVFAIVCARVCLQWFHKNELGQR